jgi:hypothetical protein
MSSFQFNDISYNITGVETVEVGINSNYTSSSLTIPNIVTNNSVNYSVTSIKTAAFQFNTFITSVIFPSSLKTINSNSFYSCKSLTSIDLTNCTSLTSFGANSFGNCYNFVNQIFLIVFL